MGVKTNKIVQRFYETPEGLSSGSNKQRFTRRLFGWLKSLSPQPRRRDFCFASTRFWGISEFLPQPPDYGTALSL